MFFFKKKKLVVECFTLSETLAKVGIPRASRFLPDWWKDLPKSVNIKPTNSIEFPTFTMKTCPGFLDLYKIGNILPLWSEIIIEVDEISYKWKASYPGCPPITEHPKVQFSTEKYKINEKWRHAKFESPWAVRCKKDVKFICIEPSYNQLNNDFGIKVLPGVFDFKYQNGLHINTFIPAQSKRMHLEYMYPLAHLICLDNSYDVEFKSIQVGQEEYGKINRFAKHRPYFLNSFNKLKKCPFHND